MYENSSYTSGLFILRILYYITKYSISYSIFFDYQFLHQIPIILNRRLPSIILYYTINLYIRGQKKLNYFILFNIVIIFFYNLLEKI